LNNTQQQAFTLETSKTIYSLRLNNLRRDRVSMP
jgi:hypothetical protein